MNSKIRVLVTGSRIGVGRQVVCNELTDVYENQFSGSEEFTVVHGGASGVDTYASNWAFWMRRLGHNVRTETHLAQWRQDGVYVPSAGHQRNQKMVDLGADLVLCFIYNNSAGATGCMRAAMRAGLEVRVLRIDDQEEA
jgi:hypothetical protein